MINLIPIKEKKKIQKDFYLRIVIVFFVILGTSILISSILLIPSFFYSSIQKNLISNQLDNLKNNNTVEIKAEYASVIFHLDKKLKIINESQNGKFLISEKVINEVLNTRTNGIVIDQINYNYDPLVGRTIDIKGIALTRESLLFYKNNLENNPNFESATLPISNFIKPNNIPFSLIIKMI